MPEIENEIAVVEDTTAVSPINQLDLVDIDYAVKAQKNFEGLVEALLDKENDYQSGKKKKSAWRKLARAFNISDEKICDRIIRDDDHQIISAYFEVKAILPNGRYGIGVGDCSIFDKINNNDTEMPSKFELRKRFTNPEHDVVSTAHTRAKSRAIADLIGAGEVSAEELNGPTGPIGKPAGKPKPAKPKTNGKTSTMGNKPKAPKKKAPSKKTPKPKIDDEAIEVEPVEVHDMSNDKQKKSLKDIIDSDKNIRLAVDELQAQERTVNRDSIKEKLLDLVEMGTVKTADYDKAVTLLE